MVEHLLLVLPLLDVEPSIDDGEPDLGILRTERRKAERGGLVVRLLSIVGRIYLFDPYTSKAKCRLTIVSITTPGFSRITARGFLTRLWGIFCAAPIGFIGDKFQTDRLCLCTVINNYL